MILLSKTSLFRNLLTLVLLLTLSVIIFSKLSVNAQTPSPAPANPVPAVPVDLSNSVLPGCQMSILGASTATGITMEQKQKFLVGCFQEIIRFITVLAFLGALLQIALSGLKILNPISAIDGGGAAETRALKDSLQNTVIGIFLLVIGWNMITLFNQSFINADFFNLPDVTHCKIANACETAEQKAQREGKNAVTFFEKIVKENKFSGPTSQLLDIKKTLALICSKKTDPTYKDLDTKFCDTKYVEKIDKINNNGSNNPDDFAEKFFVQLENYKKAKAENATQAKLIELSSEAAAYCDTYNFQNSTTAKGKEANESCKKIETNRIDFFKNL